MLTKSLSLKKNKRSPSLKRSKSLSMSHDITPVYFIGGHGENDVRYSKTVADPERATFPVPKGCTIVIKTVPGKLSYNLIDIYTSWIRLNKSILQHPKQHQYELEKQFGPLTIKTEGESCARLSYQLFSYHKSHDKLDILRFKHKFNGLSGVFTYDNAIIGRDGYPVYISVTELITKYKLDKVDIKEDDDSIIEYINKIITQLYEYSVYPTKKNIHDALNENKKKYIDIFKNYKTIEKKLKYIMIEWLNEPIINVDQEFLHEKLKPGVYFNFVCRDDPILTKAMFEKDNTRKPAHILGYNQLRNDLPLRTHINMQQLIKNTISETEQSRKHGAKLRTNRNMSDISLVYKKLMEYNEMIKDLNTDMSIEREQCMKEDAKIKERIPIIQTLKSQIEQKQLTEQLTEQKRTALKIQMKELEDAVNSDEKYNEYNNNEYNNNESNKYVEMHKKEIENIKLLIKYNLPEENLPKLEELEKLMADQDTSIYKSSMYVKMCKFNEKEIKRIESYKKELIESLQVLQPSSKSVVPKYENKTIKRKMESLNKTLSQKKSFDSNTLYSQIVKEPPTWFVLYKLSKIQKTYRLHTSTIALAFLRYADENKLNDKQIYSMMVKTLMSYMSDAEMKIIYGILKRNPKLSISFSLENVNVKRRCETFYKHIKEKYDTSMVIVSFIQSRQYHHTYDIYYIINKLNALIKDRGNHISKYIIKFVNKEDNTKTYEITVSYHPMNGQFLQINHMMPVSEFLVYLATCFSVELNLDMLFMNSKYSNTNVDILNSFNFEKNTNEDGDFYYIDTKKAIEFILSSTPKKI